MYIRVFISRFPNENKKKLALAFIQTITSTFESNSSKLLDFQILDIGEGKILNIARYNTKKDFEDTNKWLQPEFLKMMKELDGVVESIPGEVVFTWSKQINKV